MLYRCFPWKSPENIQGRQADPMVPDNLLKKIVIIEPVPLGKMLNSKFLSKQGGTPHERRGSW
jgi:hypothetical protein